MVVAVFVVYPKQDGGETAGIGLLGGSTCGCIGSTTLAPFLYVKRATRIGENNEPDRSSSSRNESPASVEDVSAGRWPEGVVGVLSCSVWLPSMRRAGVA